MDGKSSMYESTTRKIRVRVEPEFLDQQSEPNESRFVWAYHIRIENVGDTTVQLVSRYWRITDGNGAIQEVRGSGVVGEQPILNPGAAYEYTSGTPLGTPSGFMGGRYQMVGADGERFEVEIPTFSLDSPHQTMRIH